MNAINSLAHAGSPITRRTGNNSSSVGHGWGSGFDSSAQRVNTGSPSKLKARTFRVTFHFPTDETPQRLKPHSSSKCYRNPVILAQEWQQAFKSGAYGTQADFAQKRGISRARVTQVLHLLNLAPDVLHTIAALGDPLSSRTVTERVLRSLVHRSADEQRQEIGSILAKATTEQQFQLDLSDLSSPNSSEES